MHTTNLIFAGVGGQGVLLAAELTARAAMSSGFDVKQTEVHGVSQRGGSVESHVRFGERVFSPLVRPGQADVVFGLEKLEALRFARYLRVDGGVETRPAASLPYGGILLVNDHEIVPASVANAAERYPRHALDFLRGKGLEIIALPASRAARDLGDGRMANMVLLGALAALLDFREEVWMDALNETLPSRYRAANLRAFQAGRETLIAARPSVVADGATRSAGDGR